MASISSPSGVQAAAQQGWQQLQLQQAKRAADQAEQVASALRAQAASAQRTADRAQESARSLTVQSDRAETSAGQARQGVAAMQTRERMVASLGSQVSNAVEQVTIRQQADKTPVTASPAVTAASSAVAAPVVNSQGQVTGTVINTTA